MRKKSLIIILSIFVILAIFGIVTRYIDGGRVATNNEPKFCVKMVSEDGSKVTYWGLGYKVIRYVGVSPNEPYKSNIGVKMGSWFMKYEMPKDKEGIKSIDAFYNTTLTQNKDIRNLGKNYTTFDAQKDNCFVIGAMVHNDNLYNEFMENYKKSKSSLIRVAKNTIEGDLILYDVLYNEKLNRIYIVTDNTRDEFAGEDNKKIELKEYKKIGTYQNETGTYWVAYNEEINEDNFNTENTFVIAKIN